MPYMVTRLLSDRSHAVHHHVMLQGRALLQLKGRRPFARASPGIARQSRMNPLVRPHGENWGRCAATHALQGHHRYLITIFSVDCGVLEGVLSRGKLLEDELVNTLVE
jgi:hypothetical protein